MNTVKSTLSAVSLLLDDCRGIYIPRDFVEGFRINEDQAPTWKVEDLEAIEICKDPEHEYYWDAWQDILDNATFTENGNTWCLYQDGAVWALCPELMDDEEKQNWGYSDD